MILDAIGMVHRGTGTGHQGGRLCGRVNPGRLLDQFCRDPCDLFCRFRRERFNIGPVFLEALRPVLHEFHIREFLFYDDMGHGVGKGPRGAGTNPQMYICMGGHRCNERPHLNDF